MTSAISFPDNVHAAANTTVNNASVAKMAISISLRVHVSTNWNLEIKLKLTNSFFSSPFSDCNCDLQGTLSEICDKIQGKCLCKEGYGGPRCDQCIKGYYNYPECVPCNCSAQGSSSTHCDTTGKCPCVNSFAGKQCTQCSAGYFNYPECLRKYLSPHQNSHSEKLKQNCSTFISQLAPVSRLDRMEFRVMPTANALASITSMAKRVANAKKVSTIFLLARNAIAIRLV